MKTMEINNAFQNMNNNHEESKAPHGGIGIFVCNKFNNKILVGKRMDNGLFAFPGGWLEYGEEWEECGSRELREETGLNILPERIHHIKTFNCYNSKTGYHNVAIYLFTEIDINEANSIVNMEPDKCEKWEWVDFKFLFENYDKIFFPIQVFLEKNKNIDTVDKVKKLVHN
jgi:8-oxo-dGTP diphosphatase